MEDEVPVARVGPGFLRRALGRPLTGSELEAWLLASSEKRALLVTRIKAVRSWARLGSDPAAKARLARRAGMTDGGLRNLVAAWRRDRSLEIMGVRTKKHSSRVRKPTELANAAEELGDLAALHPHLTDEALVRLALDAGKAASGLGLSTLRALLRKARSGNSGRRFGRRILFDELPLALLAPSGIPWRALLVLDQDTGFILSMVVDDADVSLPLIDEAASAAAKQLREHSIPGLIAADEPPEIVMPSTGSFPGMLRFLRTRHGWDVADGAARGRGALTVLGGALGRLRFAQGVDRGRSSTRSEEVMPTLLRHEVEQLVELLARRRNEALIDPDSPETSETKARRLMLADLLTGS